MSVNLDSDIKYCPYCQTALEYRELAGRTRPWCPSCKTGFFADPKLAVAVVIEYGERIVLQRRTIDPGAGLWTFPSGFVDRGEPVEEAAIREAWEEVGVYVRLTRLLGLYSSSGETVVLVVYVAEAESGRLESRDENDAVGLFSPDELPQLAFPNDDAIIETWLRGGSAPVKNPVLDDLN